MWIDVQIYAYSVFNFNFDPDSDSPPAEPEQSICGFPLETGQGHFKIRFAKFFNVNAGHQLKLGL